MNDYVCVNIAVTVAPRVNDFYRAVTVNCYLMMPLLTATTMLFNTTSEKEPRTCH